MRGWECNIEALVLLEGNWMLKGISLNFFIFINKIFNNYFKKRMHFWKIINCSFLMCRTWPKAMVVKLQIKKNGQGLKGVCGWIKVDKWYFHGNLYTLCVKIESTYSIKSSNTKKTHSFWVFFKITYNLFGP